MDMLSIFVAVKPMELTKASFTSWQTNVERQVKRYLFVCAVDAAFLWSYAL